MVQVLPEEHPGLEATLEIMLEHSQVVSIRTTVLSSMSTVVLQVVQEPDQGQALRVQPEHWVPDLSRCVRILAMNMDL